MKPNIVKLVANGHYYQAIQLYSKLHSSLISPNIFTFPCLLKACSKLNQSLQGHILHSHIIKTGFISNMYTATALTHMYMNFGEVGYARKVFDEMPQRNEASVGAMISGFSKNGYWGAGFVVFREVGVKMFRPNSVMIASVLSGCDDVVHGSQVHCWANKIGVEKDVFVGTGLVTMYMNCSESVLATKAFEVMVYKNVVSYNAFLNGLVQNGVNRVVLMVFKDMLRLSDDLPNSGSLVSVLCACSSVPSLVYGRQVHGYAVKVGLQTDTMVGTALVDMYAKCGSSLAYCVFREMNGNRSLITWNTAIAGMFLTGDCITAVELFSELKSEGLVPDSATWNSMISGLSRQGKCVEAFDLFTNMVNKGIAPSLKLLTSLLAACSISSSLQKGKEIHGYALKADISTDMFFVTSLIDLYMKCGQPGCARKVFDQLKLSPTDPPIWNAMISGYGRNGDQQSAFEIFSLMQEKFIHPNSTTFTNVLSVCSHTGQIDKGLQVFEMMTRDYNLTPTPQHFACIIDLLGRSGHLEKAQELINEASEDASLFTSLLAAAGYHSDLKVGEDMANELSELQPEDSASYVILSNIYAAMGRWNDVERIRNMMVVEGVQKSPAYSLPTV